MIKQFLKTTLAGILAGLALFVLPFFFIRMLMFFLLIGAIFKLLGGGRRGMHRYAFAHKYQNMSAEERTAFKSQFGNSCCRNTNFREQEAPKETKTDSEPTNQ